MKEDCDIDQRHHRPEQNIVVERERKVPADEKNVITPRKEGSIDNEYEAKRVGWFQRGSSAKSR